ncbi:hypothetical protein LTR36_000666 [Oleoguttula mirabilis]|uniref:Uncharacterized protein n=1 Tax=Oleoguttula mirabilis TaxID=1507867 RepID=A0AAV9JR68_9PEZI|nr:hypothetical protein LTR36_000666 [Oleoguttula mirabilis]
MEQGNAPVPDLQAILATLSQYTGSAGGVPLQHLPEHYAPPPVELGHVAFERSATSTPQPAPAEKAHDPRLRPQARSAIASPKPMIDPATITTWQEGLRCVTKIAARNVQFVASIKKMMDDQRKHEMRWYSERQALKQMQNNRKSSSAKAASILQSLGSGPAVAPTSAEAEADNQVELSEYDRKIHVAQRSMEEAMTAELKGLGVPFFGTDLTLVVPDGYNMTKEHPPESHPKWSALVTEGELLALRRRMVGHLEDLYRD